MARQFKTINALYEVLRLTIRTQSVSDCSLHGTENVYLNYKTWRGGCCSVGRVVASNTRRPQFESSHLQNFIMNIFTVNCFEKIN